MKLLLTQVSPQSSKWSAGIAARFSFLDLSHFLSHTKIVSTSHFFPHMLAHSQGSKSSILFLWVTSISNTYSSIQPFLYPRSKGSDCTDRPWHPPSKSRWAKSWELSAHETHFRLRDFSISACSCQQPNRQTHSEPCCWGVGLAELHLEDKCRVSAWILEDPPQRALRGTSEASPGGFLKP